MLFFISRIVSHSLSPLTTKSKSIAGNRLCNRKTNATMINTCIIITSQVTDAKKTWLPLHWAVETRQTKAMNEKIYETMSNRVNWKAEGGRRRRRYQTGELQDATNRGDIGFVDAPFLVRRGRSDGHRWTCWNHIHCSRRIIMSRGGLTRGTEPMRLSIRSFSAS